PTPKAHPVFGAYQSRRHPLRCRREPTSSDADAIALKVRQEFAAKEKVRGAGKLAASRPPKLTKPLRFHLNPRVRSADPRPPVQALQETAVRHDVGRSSSNGVVREFATSHHT